MMNGRKFIRRLQGLPEFQKKIIVWGATILLAIALLVWWIPRMSERLEIPQGPSIEEQFQLRELQNQVRNIPVQINGEQ